MPGIRLPEADVTTTISHREVAKASPRRKRPIAGRAISAIALLPFLVFLLVFAVYPLAEILRLAFSDTSVQKGAFVSAWAGFANFGPALSRPEVLSSLGITALFVILAVVLSVVGGLALALILNRTVFLLKVARSVLLWPMVIAPVVVSLMWLLLLSPTVGGVNKVLASMNLPTQGWLDSAVGAFIVIVLVDLWHWTPLAFLFLYTALQAIDAEVIEAARVDGASERQILKTVVIPMLAPTLAIVTVLRLVMSVKAFDEMYLLTRGGPNGATNLISLEIRTMFFDRLDFGGAAVLSLTVVFALIMTLATAVLLRKVLKGERT